MERIDCDDAELIPRHRDACPQSIHSKKTLTRISSEFILPNTEDLRNSAVHGKLLSKSESSNMKYFLPVLLFFAGIQFPSAQPADTVWFQVALHGFPDSTVYRYVVGATDTTLIQQAQAQLALPVEERTQHVNGLLAYGHGGFNAPWSWHIPVDDWVLADYSIELCDGLPEHVEHDLNYWIDTVGQFCSWSSYLADTLSFPCQLIPDPGPCDGAFPRYFFNQETGQCELFTWGGCDGVVPFETWQECVSGCQDSGLVEIEGHYSWGFEVNAIYPCDTMEQWWIGLDTVGLYDCYIASGTDSVYVFARGWISPPGNYGHMGIYDREFIPTELITCRPQQPDDCEFYIGVADDIAAPAPDTWSLAPNYPNPFNPVTTIRFALPTSAHVTLKIIDLRGRLIATLLNQVLTAGSHSVLWTTQNRQGETVPSGVYFIILESPDFKAVRKMAVLR